MSAFGPLECGCARDDVVLMTVDEYEAIRLIDREGMTQEECAASMDIARTTVQRIYDEARRKLAACLVDARPLRIEGGDYAVHEPEPGHHGAKGCPRRARGGHGTRSTS